MTPEQHTKMIESYKKYLDNNYPTGKRGSKADTERKETERAILVGAYAYATATNGDGAEPWLAFTLMGCRYPSGETKEAT